jgi:hypothetical protein
MKHLRKMFTAFIATALTGLAAATVVGPDTEGFAGISQAELFSALASAVVVALGVYIIPNTPPTPPTSTE